jgi:hypothetical protein
MNETSTAPRASASLPGGRTGRKGQLTRLLSLLVVAAVIGALASIVTAGIAISSFFESRSLRAQIAETRLGPPPLAETPGTSPGAPMMGTAPVKGDVRNTAAAWDALPPSTPIVIVRAEVDTALANLGELAQHARIVPAFENGKNVGFKFFSIRPGSLWDSALHLQNGDIVRRINGHDLASPEAALEVYTKLKDTTELHVDIERRGTPMRLHYTVK